MQWNDTPLKPDPSAGTPASAAAADRSYRAGPDAAGQPARAAAYRAGVVPSMRAKCRVRWDWS